MGGSTKCFSIENGGAVSEARSRRVGPSRSVLIGVGFTGPIIDPLANFRVRRAGRRKEQRKTNPLKNGRTGGGTEEEDMARAAPSFKDHALCLRSYLTPA
jgi:hypothetical protein